MVEATTGDKDPLIPLICGLPLAHAGQEPPAQLDDAYLFWLPSTALHPMLSAAAPDRREAILLRLMGTTRPSPQPTELVDH